MFHHALANTQMVAHLAALLVVSTAVWTAKILLGRTWTTRLGFGLTLFGALILDATVNLGKIFTARPATVLEWIIVEVALSCWLRRYRWLARWLASWDSRCARRV